MKIRYLLAAALLVSLILPHGPSTAFAGEKSIGIIMTGDLRYYRDIQNAFMTKMEREGYHDKVKVIVQTPYPDNISLSNAVRKLIAVDVDVIVTYGAPATIAACNEKTKIPVVYADVYEPIASGLKAPNATGIGSRLPISSLLRYLRGLGPISTLGILYSPGEEDSSYQARELYKLSERYGFKAETIKFQGQRNAKAVLSGSKADALIITHSCAAGTASSEIEDFIKTRRVPTASLIPGKNYIITLYVSPRELGEKSAERVIKILGGVSPESIGRTGSSATELVLNLKEVVSMGLDIPVELVTGATRLIK